VRLADLAPLHPGWSDVRRLDAMAAHVAALRPAPAGGAPQLLEVRMPPPLPPASESADDVVRTEQALIRHIAEPASARVDSLQNTLTARIEREAAAERARVELRTEEEVRRLRQQMTAEARAQQERIRREAHVRLRDLGLKEIACQSQVDALYPSEARAEAQQKLQATRKGMREAQEARDAALAQVEASLRERIAGMEAGERAEAAREVARFRADQEDQARRIVEDSKSVVRFVLGSLDPLKVPRPGAPAAVRARPLPSPARAASQPAPAQGTILGEAGRRSADELWALRRRLVGAITAEVRLRLERIALQKHWRLAWTPAPGLPDLTREAAEALRRELSP